MMLHLLHPLSPPIFRLPVQPPTQTLEQRSQVPLTRLLYLSESHCRSIEFQIRIHLKAVVSNFTQTNSYVLNLHIYLTLVASLEGMMTAWSLK